MIPFLLGLCVGLGVLVLLALMAILLLLLIEYAVRISGRIKKARPARKGERPAQHPYIMRGSEFSGGEK